jgi:hypothetical protein
VACRDVATFLKPSKYFHAFRPRQPRQFYPQYVCIWFRLDREHQIGLAGPLWLALTSTVLSEQIMKKCDGSLHGAPLTAEAQVPLEGLGAPGKARHGSNLAGVVDRGVAKSTRGVRRLVQFYLRYLRPLKPGPLICCCKSQHGVPTWLTFRDGP